MLRKISVLLFQLVFFDFPAFAQSQPAQPSFSEIMGRMMPMFVLVFFIFYFMVIKPQQEKAKQQKQLLESLKKGDTVVTSGGIIAKVLSVESDHVVVDANSNCKLKVEKVHITKLQEKEAA